MVFDRPINRDVFYAYIEQVLVDELRPGDIVVWIISQAIRLRPAVRSVEAAGVSLLYLPPNSPNFNQIEPAFSK